MPLHTPPGPVDVDPTSAEAGGAAATEGGRWKPAAFDGTGVPDGHTTDYQLQVIRPAVSLRRVTQLR